MLKERNISIQICFACTSDASRWKTDNLKTNLSSNLLCIDVLVWERPLESLTQLLDKNMDAKFCKRATFCLSTLTASMAFESTLSTCMYKQLTNLKAVARDVCVHMLPEKKINICLFIAGLRVWWSKRP